VKRRSRINFSFAPERIERLKATPEFWKIATSDKPAGRERDKDLALRSAPLNGWR
jgi:hypothetical protein